MNHCQHSINQNPFEKLFQSMKVQLTGDITCQQAEQLVRQLGYMYNTLGSMMKDLIQIISYQFHSNNALEIQIKAQKKKNQNQEQIQNQKIQKLAHEENFQKQQILQKKGNNTGFQKKIISNIQKKKNSQQKNNIQMDLMQIQQNEYNVLALDNFKFVPTYKNNQKNQINQNNKYSKESKIQRVRGEQQNLQYQNIVQIDDDDDINDLNYNNYKQSKQKTFQPEKISNLRDNSYKSGPPTIQPTIRIEPGRKRKQREKLIGISCPDCKQFYSALGVEGSKICSCSSRHKSTHPMNEKFDFSNQLSFS